MKHQDIIAKLSLEQKCALLSGGTVFTTRALPGKGIPAITCRTAPTACVRRRVAADHLGLNPRCARHLLPHLGHRGQQLGPELGEAVAQPWARKQRHRACRCCWAPA